MDLFISTVDFVKRQEQGKSGAGKLLDLLADPYRSQVSLCVIFTHSMSNRQLALPVFHLRKFGHVDRLHLTPCPRILPSETLQLRRVFTEIKDCRRETCPSTDGKGNAGVGGAGSENEGARLGGSDWTRRYGLSESFEDVPEYVPGDNCTGMWDLNTGQLVQGSEVLTIECSEHGHACQYIRICQLGDGDMRMAV